MTKHGFATEAIHAGEGADPATGALTTPIYQSATFAFGSAGEKEAAVDAAMRWEPGVFFYSRTNNPTTAALEVKLAALENAEDAVVSSAGMAACATALLSVLNAGDHAVVSDDLFVITGALLDEFMRDKGIAVTHVDCTDLEAVRAAVRPNTRVIYTEALSNPHLVLVDVAALADLAHGTGLMLIVDNTFLSPAVLRPLDLGADLVVHSATKWLGGHGDALAGVVAGAKSLVDRVRFHNDTLGSAPSPFNSWLVLRGVRTLPLRMRMHSENALAVARLLAERPEIEQVRYPGLDTHPQHTLAREQFVRDDSFGGMISLRIRGGFEVMDLYARSLSLSAIGVSLGDMQSLVYPMPKRDNLIRLSVGCEDTRDLVADHAAALDRVAEALALR